MINLIPDSAVFSDIWKQIPTSCKLTQGKAYALFKGVEYVLERDLPGALVVHGSGNDGAADLIALLLTQFRQEGRCIVVLNHMGGAGTPYSAELRDRITALGYPSENIRYIDHGADETGTEYNF